MDFQDVRIPLAKFIESIASHWSKLRLQVDWMVQVSVGKSLDSQKQVTTYLKERMIFLMDRYL